MLHLLVKHHYPLIFPSLDIFWKPSIPWINIQLCSPWCHGSHLCFHPRGSPSVSKPKCSFCLFILEIWVLCIHLHPEIQRNWLSEVLLTVYAIQAIITIKLYWFLLSTRGLWQKSSSFTFSDLWSHHCEGSEKNSLQSFSFWAAWTTGTG